MLTEPADLGTREGATSRLRSLWQREDVRFVVSAFLVGRVAMNLLAIVGWQLPHYRPERATLWSAAPPDHWWHAAFTGFERFDALWHLQIASHGYEGHHDPSGAFFPLYPLLVRVVGLPLGGRWLLAATLVSNAALLVALLLLYRLTERELSTWAARSTVVLLLCSPMAPFLWAPYTESLFLALSVAALGFARDARWLPAGSAALLASATRSTGLVVGLAIGIEALRQTGWRPRSRADWVRLGKGGTAAAASGLGVVAYLGYWWTRGAWAEPLSLQQTAFRRQPAWPWDSVVRGVQVVADTWRVPEFLVPTLESSLALAALALGVVAVRRYAAPYVALTLGGLVVPLCLVRSYAPLDSVARYDLVVFPLFWSLAELTRKRVSRILVLAVFVPLVVLLTLLLASWHDVI